jgi:hypothetical protein
LYWLGIEFFFNITIFREELVFSVVSEFAVQESTVAGLPRALLPICDDGISHYGGVRMGLISFPSSLTLSLQTMGMLYG